MNITSELACLNGNLSLVQETLDNLTKQVKALETRYTTEIVETTKEPEPGELIWVRNSNTNNWVPRVFIEIRDTYARCAYVKPTQDSMSYPWKYWKFYNELKELDYE